MPFSRLIKRMECTIVLALVTLVSVFSRLHAGGAFLAFYNDDLFYYLQIARNLASCHGSTFDGIHQSNGYHPLWLMILAVLSKLFSGPVVLFLVICLIFASTMTTYFLAERCFNRVAVSAFTASLCAMAVAFTALLLSSGGMEILLTIPLVLGLFYFRLRPSSKWDLTYAVQYGFLASVVVLSRLDSILLIAILFVLEIMSQRGLSRSGKLRLALAIVAGMFLLAFYVALNLRFFGAVLPISGQAKQLRIHHGFSIAPVKTFLFGGSIYTKMLIVFPAIVSIAWTVWRIAKKGWGNCSEQYRPLVAAVLVFPLVHIVSLSWLSDWPVWTWYLYSFVVAEAGACLFVLCQNFGLSRYTENSLIAGGAAFLLFIMFTYAAGRVYTSTHPKEPIYANYHAAVRIQDFSQTHPGVYAMGDRAGVTGYLLGNPLIQLEGLVMDKEYLKEMQTDSDLLDVLHRYGVHYLIATAPAIHSGCYKIREPVQAGNDSYAMTGTICDKPLLQFSINGIETDIFDLAPVVQRI